MLVVLAVNGEAVESRTAGALNQSAMFYYVRLTPFYFICILSPLLC